MVGASLFHDHASSPYLSESRSSQKMHAASKAFNLTTPKQVFHLFDFIKQQQYTQVKRFFALLLKCHSSVHAPFLQQAKVCSAERAYLCCTMYACPLDEDTIAALIHTHCALRPHTIILIKSAERLHAGGCDKQHCILNGDNKRGATCCAPLMIFTIRYPLILLRNLPPYTLRYSPHP